VCVCGKEVLTKDVRARNLGGNRIQGVSVELFEGLTSLLQL
jgi:hypothetical protein